MTPGAPQLSSFGLPRVFPFGSVCALSLCSAGRAGLTHTSTPKCLFINSTPSCQAVPAPVDKKKIKKVRHNAPKIEGLHGHLHRLCLGHDASVLPGLTPLSWMKLTAELGPDLRGGGRE